VRRSADALGFLIPLFLMRSAVIQTLVIARLKGFYKSIGEKFGRRIGISDSIIFDAFCRHSDARHCEAERILQVYR
jgi:hypothetical protein